MNKRSASGYAAILGFAMTFVGVGMIVAPFHFWSSDLGFFSRVGLIGLGVVGAPTLGISMVGAIGCLHDWSKP